MCQLSIDQRYTFWVGKIDYVNKIDLRSAVKKFYVRGKGLVLAKIGRYTLNEQLTDGSSDLTKRMRDYSSKDGRGLTMRGRV